MIFIVIMELAKVMSMRCEENPYEDIENKRNKKSGNNFLNITYLI